MRKQIDFNRDLIKGKIAEIIFEQMFREVSEFTVLKLGYEYTSPQLAQYRNHLETKEALDTIKSIPDFALISNDKKRIFVVEVKYRSRREKIKLKSIAKSVLKSANPSWMFIVSPDGFFFDSCINIQNIGYIKPLANEWIALPIQSRYLMLLEEFNLGG